MSQEKQKPDIIIDHTIRRMNFESKLEKEKEKQAADAVLEEKEQKIPKDESEKESEKDSKESDKIILMIIASLVIVFLLIFGIRLLVKQQQTQIQEREYNNYKFLNISGLWMTEVQNPRTKKIYQVPLHFGPWELEDIKINGNIDQRFNSSKIYITFDPEQKDLGYVTISVSELSNSLAQAFGANLIAACTKNLTGCENRPIVTCSTTNDTVIYISQESNESRIILRGNCVTIQGQKYSVVKSTERFIYQIYDVMN